MDLHLSLKRERETARKTASAVAGYLGISEDMVRRYESGRSDITLRQAERYCEFLGRQLGDVLPGSQMRSSEMQPFVMALQDFEPEERSALVEKATRDLVFLASMMGGRSARHTDRSAKILDFPDRTEPRWTEDFPVQPDQFIEKDFDFPRELHALEVEEYEVAAGATGVASELADDMAYTLNAKDVRDSTHRVIKVRGDSMAPDYEEGWKLLVDMKKTKPQPGDPVAVYLEDEGGVIGYWEPTKGGITLEKANPSYKPLKLGDPTTWRLIGTVQKVVDMPAKRRRKK